MGNNSGGDWRNAKLGQNFHLVFIHFIATFGWLSSWVFNTYFFHALMVGLAENYTDRVDAGNPYGWNC